MTCSIDGCGAPVYCRGWCTIHYGRWHRCGDPHIARRPGPHPRSVIERMADKFLVGEGCWPWLGSRHNDGYGQVRGDAQRNEPAHRVLYELLVGPIPPTLHLDHLCNNPNCVRPGHLEPVTQGENNRRAAIRRRFAQTEWSDRYTLREHGS